jgi:short-subunit dehydrogenase
MERPIAGQVVVITGASSGIGRAAALMLAERGASLVLAARNQSVLDEIVAEVIRRGGHAVAIPTDVADPTQVERLAEEAISRFGRIDTWVNGAAMSVYALVEQLTYDEMRRVVEVDLLGTMYGAKAVLPHLRQSRGTLINISSVMGKVPIPLQAPYSAAKHGIIGFSDALRIELAHERAGVTVTTILPYAINTPFFNHARSKLGVLPQPTPPAYRPEAVAEAIVWAAAHPTREIVVGGAAKSTLLLRWLSPSLVDWLLTAGGLGIRLQKSNRPDDGVDALFAPAPGPYDVRGEFDQLTIPGNAYTRMFEFHPERQRLVAAGLLLALAALVRWGGRR